jgi:hypothetical protein
MIHGRRPRFIASVVVAVEVLPGCIDRLFHLFTVERRAIVAVEPFHRLGDPATINAQADGWILLELFLVSQPSNES